MSADDPIEAPDGGEDPRLSALEERLRKVNHTEKLRTDRTHGVPGVTGKGATQGHKILSVLIGGPLGAALIGWLIDRWLETSPVAILIMLFLGFGAAMSQIIRISKEDAS